MSRRNWSAASNRSRATADRAEARAGRMSKPRKLFARHLSHCPRCHNLIRPGDEIVRNLPSSNYRHAMCVEVAS